MFQIFTAVVYKYTALNVLLHYLPSVMHLLLCICITCQISFLLLASVIIVFF